MSVSLNLSQEIEKSVKTKNEGDFCKEVEKLQLTPQIL